MAEETPFDMSVVQEQELTCPLCKSKLVREKCLFCSQCAWAERY